MKFFKNLWRKYISLVEFEIQTDTPKALSIKKYYALSKTFESDWNLIANLYIRGFFTGEFIQQESSIYDKSNNTYKFELRSLRIRNKYIDFLMQRELSELIILFKETHEEIQKDKNRFKYYNKFFNAYTELIPRVNFDIIEERFDFKMPYEMVFIMSEMGSFPNNRLGNIFILENINKYFKGSIKFSDDFILFMYSKFHDFTNFSENL